MDRSDPEWWRRAVFYQHYIRSFADPDGDGIGDAARSPGVRQRYLPLDRRSAGLVDGRLPADAATWYEGGS